MFVLMGFHLSVFWGIIFLVFGTMEFYMTGSFQRIIS